MISENNMNFLDTFYTESISADNPFEAFNGSITNLNAKIGDCGGRRYYADTNDQETVSLDDIVKVYHNIVNNTVGSQKLEQKGSATNVFSTISELDTKGEKSLENIYPLLWVITKIKQRVGYLFYQRDKVLGRIQTQISGLKESERLKGPCSDEVLTGELMQIQREIEARGIPLRVNPKRPTKSFPIDREEAKKYIGHSAGEYQTLAQTLIENIQHITMDMLEARLQDCIEEFKQKIGDQQYSVGLVHGKSFQWVAGLALSHLGRDHLPNSHFGVSKGGTIVSSQDCEEEVGSVQEENLVIFDDCSYSGSQLWENIQFINDKVRNKKKLYIVIPFLSTKARELIINYRNQFPNLQIEVITSDYTIRNLSEVFDFNKKSIQTFLENNGHVSDRHTLCYTDWRFPDGKSIPTMLEESLDSLSENGICQWKLYRKEPKRCITYFKTVEARSLNEIEDEHDAWKPIHFKVLPEPKSIKRPYELESLEQEQYTQDS